MYARYVKRILDVIFSLIILVLASWVFFITMAAYLVAGQRQIFFVQPRIGMGERPFLLYKFRTLKADTTLADRRFALGNALRFLSLDELPQLINVLKGEMALVGPRPLPVAYLPLFSAEQRRRHSVRPGMTGLAQVNGRHSITWPAKFSYDLHYIDHLSFTLDMHIVVKTLLLLLSFRKDRSLEEKPFAGET